MGTTPLRRFLQSLCDNSCWNYAVFWKLQQQSQMLLMWEDGYFGTSKGQDSMGNMFAETNFSGLEETTSFNTYNGTLGGDAVELAVAYMSTFQYALGDGVIGDVAYTGNCRWVFADSRSSEEFNTASIPEHADEWLFQFAAGVKTILLVPVIPHGVLQLGSLEDLPEDAQMANYIREECIAHQDATGYSDAFDTNQQFPHQSPSSLMHTMMRSLDEFPSSIANGISDKVNWSTHKPLTKSLVTPSDTWYSSHLTGKDFPEPSSGAHMGAIELPEPLHQSTNLVNSSMGMLGEYADGPLRSEILMKQPLVSDVSLFLSFPEESELHKALGPAFMGNTDDSFQHLSIGEDIYSSSNQLCNKDLINSSSKKTDGMLFDDEITRVHLGENCSIQTSGESSLSNLFGQFASLAKRKNVDGKSAFEEESSLFSNHVPPAVFSKVKNHTDSSSPSAISYEGVVDEFTEEEEQKNSYDMLHQGKGSKPSVASKRRGKPGAKQKPRPRDRQLIQDRLKDLRELVPDGAKCSIDGLLDRTVKHMLFLKSVGDRAIKLRQCVQPAGVGTGSKNNTTPEEKGSQNGASWAYELGGDLKTCPIVVEDLQYPGHMIIEMICDESSRFFEIAEVIHGLELTILNGVMERRCGNTWASYIIEAPRGFHRLDIFWPLMKLLQQQQQLSPISSKI
ncbi:transcription factor LHW-like isoform X2 [Cynara cardunculus var. scolymus]|uniref:transcription factor LHW-like isoform X2 n=1 Tax=Cynara cardunculus var. scolymus TaxID=59895 RepID=UPI000D6280FA|nr:transcription factor LHW-like isoform X2 [Cynara cardunculus var. scolymus]